MDDSNKKLSQAELSQLIKEKDLAKKVAHVNKVFLRNITEALPQYVFWKDTKSVYLGCNKNYAKLVGLNSPAEIIGKTDVELPWQSTGHTAKTFQEGDRSTIQGNPITNQEEILALPSGRKLHTLVSKLPIVDGDEVIGIVGYFTDITELKEIEAQLAEAKTREARLKAMSSLGAMIAHELRTPLQAIDSGVRGIRKCLPSLIQGYETAVKNKMMEAALPPHQFNDLGSLCQCIETETQSGFTFIDMMLANIKSALSVQNEKFVSCRINRCVEEALQRYPFDEVEKKLVAWEKGDDFEFLGSELMIVHLLFNLIKNALYQIKAAHKGTITIWMQLGNQFNELHFKDTAKGISAKDLPNIFNYFYSTIRHGTGLGLAFCKRVMETIGGKIECVSQEGEYAEFVLYFPVIS